MAATVRNAGLCTVKIDNGGGGGIQTLGYSANGVDHNAEVKRIDVPGDENGGDEGPPIDIQYLGEIARVRMELTKFDTAVAALVRARVAQATAGTPATSGTFLFRDDKAFRLILDSPNDPINFPRAVPLGAFEVGRGTKYQRLVIEWECHKNAAGVLHNTSVS